jgi:hypothetical protein
MKYAIRKKSRGTSNIPYAGPSCEKAGIYPGKIYDKKFQADRDAKKLTAINRVGFESFELKCPHNNIKAGMLVNRCWDCGEFL